MKSYINSLNKLMAFENTHLHLKENDFQENSDAREHIKLLLNSALGKFNQKERKLVTKFVKNAEEIATIFQEQADDIIDLSDLSSSVCQITLRSNCPSKNRRTNPVILAFITAKARVSLHKNILQLVAANYKPFYTDTDSILFAGTNNLPPLSFGSAFGQFKHELGQNVIEKFQTYGRKNFSIFYAKDGEQEMHVKVAGMTLSSKIAKEELKELASTKNPKLCQVRNTFKNCMQTQKRNVKKICLNNVQFRCERIVNQNSINFDTKPWGFIDHNV